MAIAAGTRLGTYEITGSLGAGGMGEVYRARDTKLQRDVAIKVLPPHFANDRDRLARFEREAQSLAALNHPHIAQIDGVTENPPALVMEFADAKTSRRASHAVPFQRVRRWRSPRRLPRRSKLRTSAGSSTAISSPRTSRSQTKGT